MLNLCLSGLGMSEMYCNLVIVHVGRRLSVQCELAFLLVGWSLNSLYYMMLSNIPSLILVNACHYLFCAEAVQAPFMDADLLPTLQKMLDDPVVAVEVKFSALGLICSLANSSQYHKMNTLWKGQSID